MDPASDPSAVVVALEEARRRLRGEPREAPVDRPTRPQREVDDWFAEEEQLQEALESRPAETGPLNMNAADFDQLRAAGLSVTQAKRLLAYRDGIGGFRSLDEARAVPGFPRELLAERRSRAAL